MHLFKDIEDLAKVCPKTGIECGGSCPEISKQPLHIQFKDTNDEWHKVFNLSTLFDVLSKCGDKPYILIGGNTAHGRRNTFSIEFCVFKYIFFQKKEFTDEVKH